MEPDYIRIPQEIYDHYQKENMKKVIMLDIEDTLSDTSQRTHLSPAARGITGKAKSEDFNDWNDALVGDSPTNIIPVIKELAKKYEIVISTSKPIQYKNIARNWVNKYLGFCPDIFLMRTEYQMDLSSPDLKSYHLKCILEQGYHIAFAIDDREDICDMYEKNGIKTWWYDKNKDWGKTISEELLDSIPLENIPNLVKDNIEFNKPKDAKPETAGDILAKAAEIFKAKGEEYGNSYHEFGPILKALYPDGIELKTTEQMNRFAVFSLMLVKIQRYSHHFLDDGHKDSLDDLIVYTAMLQELDSLMKSDT